MEITDWLLAACGGVLLAGAAAYGAAWWYQRKIERLQQRFEKSRFAASQFATQTKKQIAQLQQELAARPRAAESATDARAEARRDAAAQTADRKHELEVSLEASSAQHRRVPPDGFADTQPM